MWADSSLPTDNEEKNDNAKIPGLFMNDKLYILGTRLTTSFDKYDTSVSFDMFGHAVGEGSHYQFYESWDPFPQLSYKEASEQVLFCNVVVPLPIPLPHPNSNTLTTTTTTATTTTTDTDETTTTTTTVRIPMESVPQNYCLDPNAERIQLVWRCNLSSYLSRTDLLRIWEEEGSTVLLSETTTNATTSTTTSTTTTRNGITPPPPPHVRISVFTQEGDPYFDNAGNIPILTVDIPIDTLTVGHAGPIIKSNTKPAFVQTVEQEGPLGIILCVAGIHKNSMRVLPEFIQHHINVGVSQIMLGIAQKEDVLYFQHKLSRYIQQGALVMGVHGTILEPTSASGGGGNGNNFTRIIDDYEILKLHFYNTCLYHAKGMSEYLAIWDVDELWMPPLENYYQKYGYNARPVPSPNPTTVTMTKKTNELLLGRDSPYRHAMSLPEAVRLLRGLGGCVDWCYQTFPAYNIMRAITRQHANQMMRKKKKATKMKNTTIEPSAKIELSGYYGFPSRDTSIRQDRQKPILRTKYAHQASYHNAGSCRRPATPQRGWAHPLFSAGLGDGDNYDGLQYDIDFQNCPYFREPNTILGTMHHYMDLFRHEEGNVVYPKADEYTKYMRPSILKQLEYQHDHFHAEDIT
jgi:hypothetical protein